MIREVADIGNLQFGFRPGRGTTDAVFILRELQEKHLEGSKNLYHAFVELEKAFDRVPRELVYWSLPKKGVPETPQGTSEVGLHQGSSLSPLLSIIVIDVVSEECGEGLLWETLFVDDLVISATSEKNLEAQLRKWKKALQGRGLKVNMKKNVVMRSSKGAGINIKEESGAKYDQVDEFKYLGSTMASERGCERAVKDRVKAKWREVSAVMCDKSYQLS
ncbi:uncharacterized protein LOC125044848 [Penaeus chinensis]|uniref:uncharacterized protein LOC125044848 n=1 Tax=Penaeus chinensis TaxID=139456 RepID=UPI001FB5D2A9|nr:uncharacterized protein LOC125044848 [Penaeus chinensis]